MHANGMSNQIVWLRLFDVQADEKGLTLIKNNQLHLHSTICPVRRPAHPIA